MNHPSTELKNQEKVPRIIRKQKALAERFALINRLPGFGFLELKKKANILFLVPRIWLCLTIFAAKSLSCLCINVSASFLTFGHLF